MIQVTRFPFVFWNMRDEPDAYIKDGKVIKGDKEYKLKKSSKFIFIICKYIIILIGLFFVFSRYDFILTTEKFLQYLCALVLAVIFYTIPKKFFVYFLVLLGFLVIILLISHKIYFISYLLKYFLVCYMGFGVMLDLKKNHFFVINNKKIVANILTEDN